MAKTVAIARRRALTDIDVAVVTLSADAQDWNATHVAGLAAQGIAVPVVVQSADWLEIQQDIVVLDAGSDVDSAAKAVRDAGPRSVIVCMDRPGADGMNQLIEAGAAEVLHYPVSPDTLGKRIRRVAKRRSRGGDGSAS